MIYRVHLYDDADGSHGYEYKTSKREADASLATWQKESPSTRADSAIDSAHTPSTKAELVALLDRWGSHNDNG